MIRINLLPIKHDRRKEAGRNHLIIGVLIILLELVFAYVMSMGLESEISEQSNLNQSLQAQISRVETKIAGHNAILAEIAEYEKRQGAIEELQAARTGPVHILLEISNILSKNGRPTINDEQYQAIIKKNPARGYDENWDHRRLWISSFKEESKRVTINGQAITHEDIAEFLRRINLSAYFVTSELVSTTLSKPSINSSNIKLTKVDDIVKFQLVGDIRYK